VRGGCLLELRAAGLGDPREGHAPVGPAGQPFHETGRLHPVDQSRHAAGRQRHLLGERAHGQLPLLGAGEPDEDLEPRVGEREPRLQVAAEPALQAAVNLDQSPERADECVVARGDGGHEGKLPRH
jgi:hypothetical protein